MSKTRNSVVFFLWLAAGTLMAQSTEVQPKGNSPYSRFGIGDPAALPFAGQAAMGGLSAAVNDPFYLNMVNPAALAFLNTTDLETGFYAKYSYLSEDDANDRLWSGNLNYFALGFPLINSLNRVLDKKSNDFNVGMGFVLQPFTNVGYDLWVEQSLPEVGTARSTFTGSGGTYRLMWGNGARWKNIALGANIGFLFGKMSYERSVEFTQAGPASYFTNYLDEQSINSFQWNAGGQWIIPLEKPGESSNANNKPRRLILGLYGNSASNFNSTDNRFYTRGNAGYNDRDTIVLENNIQNSGVLPGEITIGLTYEKSNVFKIGVEYASASWSKYNNPLRQESLADTRRIALGMEIIPDLFSYNNYWQRVRYRAGAYYRTDPRTINGNQLSDLGVTLGFGFPVILPRQQTSFINLAFEGGRLGATNSLSELYIRMTLGFTLNDNSWFFKRKIN